MHLDFEEQIDLLEERKMKIGNRTRAVSKLKHINYYKLKEFAEPISKVEDINGQKIRTYENVSFEQVLVRYYQDKNLRIYLMHAIEKIEISIKTQLGYVLGQGNYGPFGYLKFNNWCNRDKYCKYYLQDQEDVFKSRLKKKMRHSEHSELKSKKNLNNKSFPSVWLMIDLLTFGDVLKLLEYMSTKNLQTIAKTYDCSTAELMSWLKCLKFIRNACAHNSNVIDLKLRTTPTVKEEWKEYLFKYENKENKYTDRIAVVLFVLHHFIKEINPNYNFKDIGCSIAKLVDKDTKKANILGFKEIDSIHKISGKPRKKKRIHKKS
ncbi:CAAX protease [Brochothrix thermosphacta]|nr:CAAX protease [Brochothrix thermosphacta]